jgi:hypothetical protein
MLSVLTVAIFGFGACPFTVCREAVDFEVRR